MAEEWFYTLLGSNVKPNYFLFGLIQIFKILS